MSYEMEYNNQAILYRRTKEKNLKCPNLRTSLYLTLGILMASFIEMRIVFW